LKKKNSVVKNTQEKKYEIKKAKHVLEIFVKKKL